MTRFDQVQNYNNLTETMASMPSSINRAILKSMKYIKDKFMVLLQTHIFLKYQPLLSHNALFQCFEPL